MKKCECGCGNHVTKKHNRFILGHNMVGTVPSKERRDKQSEMMLTHKQEYSERMLKDNPMHYPEYRKKLSESCMGRIMTETTRKKISEGHKGQKNSEEHNRNISKAQKGEKNSMYGMSGDLNPNWREGASFEPYGVDFNNKLKELIRNRDNHICQLCCTPENGRALDVHHIDYDKQNNTPSNLIALCSPCHSTSEGDREIWQEELMFMVGVNES